MVWKAPDLPGLIEFLVRDFGFAEDRVRKGAEKLSLRLKSKQQGRLDGFFSALPKDPNAEPKKRKVSRSFATEIRICCNFEDREGITDIVDRLMIRVLKETRRSKSLVLNVVQRRSELVFEYSIL